MHHDASVAHGVHLYQCNVPILFCLGTAAATRQRRCTIIYSYLHQLEWNLFLLRLLSHYEQRYLSYRLRLGQIKREEKNKHDFEIYGISIDCNLKLLSELHTTLY